MLHITVICNNYPGMEGLTAKIAVHKLQSQVNLNSVAWGVINTTACVSYGVVL